MSKFFNIYEYSCWMTGGERKEPKPRDRVRNAKGQWERRIRNPQIGKNGVKHPKPLQTND